MHDGLSKSSYLLMRINRHFIRSHSVSQIDIIKSVTIKIISRRLNASRLRCWKGWVTGLSEGQKERKESQPRRRAGHNKRLVGQVHLLRQIANSRLMHFRRAWSSLAGCLYARCSRSPLILPSSPRLLWRKRSPSPLGLHRWLPRARTFSSNSFELPPYKPLANWLIDTSKSAISNFNSMIPALIDL